MTDPYELSDSELVAMLPVCPKCGRNTLTYRDSPTWGMGSTTPRKVTRIFECDSPVGAIPRCRFRRAF